MRCRSGERSEAYVWEAGRTASPPYPCAIMCRSVSDQRGESSAERRRERGMGQRDRCSTFRSRKTEAISNFLNFLFPSWATFRVIPWTEFTSRSTDLLEGTVWQEMRENGICCRFHPPLLSHSLSASGGEETCVCLHESTTFTVKVSK